MVRKSLTGNETTNGIGGRFSLDVFKKVFLDDVEFSVHRSVGPCFSVLSVDMYNEGHSLFVGVVGY
jgi:hypothetical protein